MSTIKSSTTTTTAYQVVADTTGALVIQTGATPTTAMTIDTSGNVGIGVTPVVKLDVYNSAAAAPNNEILRLRYQTSTTAGHSGDLNFTNGAGTVIGRISSVMQDGTNVALAFGTFSSSMAEQARITSTGLMQFNSGYGSVATAYGCRAWVNFNGTGTVAIRASGNVTSITDNGVGDYTVNFTTAMPDANYSVASCTTGVNTSNVSRVIVIKGTDTSITNKTTSAITIQSGSSSSGTLVDMAEINISIFR
jgi:hypothetical protein